jgi:hypothetical protein
LMVINCGLQVERQDADAGLTFRNPFTPPPSPQDE